MTLIINSKVAEVVCMASIPELSRTAVDNPIRDRWH
jgi:hypothetical protein